MQAIVPRVVPSDGQWHDVARVTLKPGIWNVYYSSWASGPANDSFNPTTGAFPCKIDLGGAVTSLVDSSNGQFGQYTDEPSKNIAAPTNVIWTCKNTVTKDGNPFDLSAEFWVSQQTPPVELDSAAL